MGGESPIQENNRERERDRERERENDHPGPNGKARLLDCLQIAEVACYPAWNCVLNDQSLPQSVPCDTHYKRAVLASPDISIIHHK